MKAELEVNAEEKYVNQKTFSKVRTVCVKKGPPDPEMTIMQLGFDPSILRHSGI